MSNSTSMKFQIVIKSKPSLTFRYYQNSIWTTYLDCIWSSIFHNMSNIFTCQILYLWPFVGLHLVTRNLTIFQRTILYLKTIRKINTNRFAWPLYECTYDVYCRLSLNIQQQHSLRLTLNTCSLNNKHKKTLKKFD